MEDKPEHLPTTQFDGQSLKPLTKLILDRRATMHFKPDDVPDDFLRAILRLGAQAPSGYNLQPWRFIVVRDPDNRKRLQQAAFDQAKVGEAPVVLIAVGMKEESPKLVDEVFREGVERGVDTMKAAEQQKGAALDFLSNVPMDVWVTRHTMIAVTIMMLVAEAYGFDTAPMEGFDPAAVKREFGIPEEAEVVALLAIGHAKERDKPYPGRFSLNRIAFSERFGEPWQGKTR